MLELSALGLGTTIVLPDEMATEDIGKQLAVLIKSPNVIFLRGELGAGKTTLVRGFLRGFGYQGAVKSPTFTLVEPYHFDIQTIYHFDLYRLNDPEELEHMGIRDYLTNDAILLVEWPEHGLEFLPKPDLILELNVAQNGRVLKINNQAIQ